MININIVNKLLNSNEPVVRLKVLMNILDKKLEPGEIIKLQEEVKSGTLVGSLLSERDKDGKIPFHPYRKWYGAHWILAILADINYPPGDKSLISLREQVYEWLFSKHEEKNIKIINGLMRRCASLEGNTLYYLLSLGLADERIEKLVERLLKWQWPDGGWNCDKNPKAINSSFMETLIPLRGLALYGKLTGNRDVKNAARNASEIFLKRKMFEIKPRKRWKKEDFIKLHYPCYWRYDILFGLKVMAEAGFIGDERCNNALEILESKQLPDGGFPAEGRYYKITQKRTTGRSLVDWDGTSKKYMNEFVTADVLYVLKKSGRLI
ncbi:hypothetical protein KAU32_01055 [bacterium]|nr:hypothetical protein [bacterium]